MRRVVIFFLLILATVATAQRRALDWSFYGGDPGRTGWEKSDSAITKDNVSGFQLVLKRKLDNGQGSLTPPVVLGNLISYRGFKELGFVLGSSDTLWSIDVDTDRIFWEKHLGSAAAQGPCAKMVTAVPSLTPPTNFARRTPTPGGAPPPGGAAPVNRGILGSGGFGAPRPAFVLANDGKLHLLNTSNGDDLIPAIPFLAANAKGSSLAISDGAIYTTTSSRCGGAAVWGLDLSAIDPKNPGEPPPVASYKAESGDISSVGGVAFGTDGTVYVQAGGSLLALAPKTLTLKSSFAAMESQNPVTPVVFAVKDHDLIVTSCRDNSLCLFDSTKPGEPVYRTPRLSLDNGVWGGLSSWQDPAGTRWVLAPVWGASGSIMAFKLGEFDGKPVLTPGWTSRQVPSPEPPVIASGIVFALSTGPDRATLYAFDGLTGKELYSTGNQVSAPANLTGITVANGRVYFTTKDDTLYAFGIALER